MSKLEADISSGDVDEFLGVPPGNAMPWFRRWGMASAVLVALLLTLTLFIVISGRTVESPYATTELQRGDMTVHVTATEIEPTKEVSVGSELSGLIEEVFVDINDKVAKDQPLAQIDPEKLTDAILRSAAALEQAKASVLQAEATVELTRASLARFEEIRRLSNGKVPSLTELDSARAEAAKRAVANLAAANASVSSAEAQLSTDRTNLAKATIRSPVDGVILSRQVEPGQTVAASFNTPTLFVIAEDMTSMKLEVKVDEADVGQVAEGQPTTFTVDAYPGKTFEAVITRVNVGSNIYDTKSTSTADAAAVSNVIAYGAVLRVDNENLALRPGMTATASILTSREQDVFAVPNAALRFQPADEGEQDPQLSLFRGRRESNEQEVTVGRGARQTLYALDEDGALVEVPVVVGNTDGAWTIVSGEALQEGMQIVTGALAIPE